MGTTPKVMRELDLAAALTHFFERRADDDKFDRMCHPSMHPLGWQAWLEYTDKLRQEHKPRVRDGRIHISYLAGEVGFNCDRALFFEMMCCDRERPPEAARTTTRGLARCFAVGHGMETEVYKWVAPSLQDYYGDDLTLHELNMEWPVFNEHTHPSYAADAELLVGTSDVRIVYSFGGGPRTTTIQDVKSTSAGRADKRRKVTGIEPEGDYVRQVGLYLEPNDAEYGGLVYWVKTWAHEFDGARVAKRPGLYRASMQRLRQLYDEHVTTCSPPLASRGSHCARCRFQNQCASIDGDRGRR